MEEIRKKLLKAMDLLGEAGMLADPLLVEEEAKSAAPSADERRVQTLAALSREIWEAHRAARNAVRTTHQYGEVTAEPSPARKR